MSHSLFVSQGCCSATYARVLLFDTLFNTLLLTCPILVAASHCNPFKHYYRNGQGFQHRNLHRVWIITTLLCNSSPRTSCSLRSGLFCLCKINPLARNSLQKKHPLNFQLNFLPITSVSPPALPPRARPTPPAPRPHGNRTERIHGNEGAGETVPLFHLWKYFQIAKTRGKKQKRQYWKPLPFVPNSTRDGWRRDNGLVSTVWFVREMAPCLSFPLLVRQDKNRAHI